MRIAILASNFIRIPPEPDFIPTGWSGAPEKIMYTITEAMVKKRHKVTLFASGDSITSARLISVTRQATSLDLTIDTVMRLELEHLHISKCFQLASKGNYDLIHTGYDIRSAYYSQFVPFIPTISTLHSPIVQYKKEILQNFKNSQYYVSISNAQRKPLTDLNYIANIYHGINKNDYPFYSGSNSNGYMIFVGRLLPEKGITTGILVAKKLQKPLYLLGTALEEKDYWKKEIFPRIDNKIIFHLGFLNPKDLISHYQNAKLFLFPIQWEEPFGLVLIEAMACGTPVVAYARGSVPEVIKDGETGFIVNSSEEDRRGDWIIKKTGIDGLCEAVERIYAMSEKQYRQMRKNCRTHIEKNFTVERMVDQYEEVYRSAIEQNKNRS